jgi:FkbM family methyltransferase
LNPPFEVKEFLSFILEKNYYFLFERLGDFREKTLDKKDEWKKLASKMSDKFSTDSIAAFLESVERASFNPLSQFVTSHEFECFNKYSRHFSFVPDDNEIYVDVGAFIGDTVTKFIESTPTGSYKSIHAFEPTPKNFQLLDNKRQWIPNLFTYNCAVSDKSGSSLFDTCDSSMGARLIDSDKQSDAGKISVKTVTLDETLSEATLIKLDVEGYENQVISGAKNLIQNNKPDIIVDTYHYANDALKIYENLMSIHEYKYVSMRFIHPNFHVHSLYFSDTQQME